MVKRLDTINLDPGETGELVSCPRCTKQVVKVRKYKNGDKLFIHSEKVRDKPFPHIMIDDSCYVRAS